MTRARLVNLGDGFAARIAPGLGDGVFWIHPYTLDSTCWADLWELLPDHTHIGLDLPGHGVSLPLAQGDSLSTLARRIGSLALAQHARHLVALSFGTIVALQVAIEYPHAFATISLGSPILGGGPFDPDIWDRYRALKQLFNESEHGPRIRHHWMDPEAGLFRGSHEQLRLWQQLQRQIDRYPWWDVSNDSYLRVWHTPQLFSALRTVGGAVLLVVGQEDSQAVKQCSHFIERLVPACQRRDLPECGHMCLLEDPERVRPLLEEHWRAHGAVLRHAEERNGHSAGD